MFGLGLILLAVGIAIIGLVVAIHISLFIVFAISDLAGRDISDADAALMSIPFVLVIIGLFIIGTDFIWRALT